MGGVEGPALGGMRADMGDKARELLFNGLVFDLVAGRNMNRTGFSGGS